MKTPVVWVTASLTAATLITATFLIVTGTRGENTTVGSNAGAVAFCGQLPETAHCHPAVTGRR